MTFFKRENKQTKEEIEMPSRPSELLDGDVVVEAPEVELVITLNDRGDAGSHLSAGVVESPQHCAVLMDLQYGANLCRNVQERASQEGSGEALHPRQRGDEPGSGGVVQQEDGHPEIATGVQGNAVRGSREGVDEDLVGPLLRTGEPVAENLLVKGAGNHHEAAVL